jgi:hypothetical protein
MLEIAAYLLVIGHVLTLQYVAEDNLNCEAKDTTSNHESKSITNGH